MGTERRRAPRYNLVAEAEILSPLLSSVLRARTSDVSLLGCFINTPYSLPFGAQIQLKLKYAGATLLTSGAVARSEPSMGFGVSFAKMKGSLQATLQRWLEQLAVK